MAPTSPKKTAGKSARAASPSFTQLRRDIRSHKVAPLYLLHGEEGYYNDELVKEFEALLPEEDRDFNLYTLYGPETGVNSVIDICRQMPVMAERQVVILKEAQAMRADQLNKLHFYAENLNPATVLVVSVRAAEAKGKDLLAAFRKNGIVFESKRLKEYNILPIISDIITEKGLTADYKALTMMRDYVGTDLAKIHNEIDKLALILGRGAMVTPEAVERNIGVSKDYNRYELTDALANRNAAKAMKIVEYFRANPKAGPTPVIVSTLFDLFSNLLVYQYCADRTEAGYLDALGLRANETWRLKNYETAARNYSVRQTIEIISAVRECDCRSKGIGSRQGPYDLLCDLVFRILTSAGNIRM